MTPKLHISAQVISYTLGAHLDFARVSLFSPKILPVGVHYRGPRLRSQYIIDVTLLRALKTRDLGHTIVFRVSSSGLIKG